MPYMNCDSNLLTNWQTYGLSFHEHDTFGASVSEPGSPECGICKANRCPSLSPEPKIWKILRQTSSKRSKTSTLNLERIEHTSALLSAFLSRSSINFADLAGHRPCPFECLFFAWAVRPTPRQNRVKGMACLWIRTSSKYLFALISGNFLIACAVSLVFYKVSLMQTWFFVRN